MHIKQFSLVTLTLLFGNVYLSAEPIPNYYEFSTPVHKVTDSTRAYYDMMGLEDYKHYQTALNKHHSKLKETPNEIFEGLQATLDAITALNKEDIKAAEKNLAQATKLFEQGFKSQPKLKFLPIDIKIDVKDHEITNKNLQSITDNAIRMLKDHKVQEAIALLSELKNQINITTIYLPLTFYTEGTQKALDIVKQGDKSGAMNAISTAFNSMLIQKNVVPIALLESQEAIEQAKRNPEASSKFLATAKKHLEQATLLGYTDKYESDYQALMNQIKSLEENSKDETLYNKLKEEYNKLLDKIVGEVPLIGA